MSAPKRSNGLRNRVPTVNIPYSIAGCSGYSGKYIPEHIKVNRPHDLASRWSAKKDPITGEQWLMLEMKSVGVLETIVFGKFTRPHPCNMKDFKIYVGMSPDNLTEVVTSSLRNDHKAETIPVPHLTRHGVVFPTRFIKIMSLSAHGQNFNTSIWNVSLYGLIDEYSTREITGSYSKRCEDVAMRHVLKHLRERRHISTYRQLTIRSGVCLEHPLVSDLYESLVLLGDWSSTERIIHSLAATDLFSSYIQSCKPQAHWRRIHAVDENGDSPSARGGHAMCMDTENGLIYLLGGFDGSRSLDDFWVYNIYTQRWRVISHNVGAEKNGPGPRSCHKMVFDGKTGCIYVLGRLSDVDVSLGQDENGVSESSPGPPTGDTRSRRSVGVNTVDQPSNGSPSSDPNDDCFSEFYRYRTRGIDQGKWELLTAAGPKLLFDHQLVIDSDAQMIYVQGGKVIGDNKENGGYGGLYSYDIRKGKWVMLSQINEPANARFGHSMILEPYSQKLFIFGGQYEGRFLSDMWEFDLYRKTFAEVTSSFTFRGGPEACFALRSVIDPNLQEVYVFEGQTKDKVGASAESAVWLYRYESGSGNWTKVLSQPQVKKSQSTPGKRARSDDEHEDDEEEIPKARVAHQVVYDPVTQTFYLHGGNAGSSRSSQRGSGEGESSMKVDSDVRLDDLWSMQLERPPPTEIIRLSKFEVRKQQFRELCEETTDPLTALHFLQKDVFEVVNHANPGEADTFRSLLSHLLAPQTVTSHGNADSTEYLDEDAQMTDVSAELDGMRHPLKQQASADLTSVDDQYELDLRDGQSLSEDRFKQRSEVFRKLVSFVNPDEREPDGNLLDMIPGSEL